MPCVEPDRRIGEVADRPAGGDAPDRPGRSSVNHMAPSGPAVMFPGASARRWELVTTPVVVMRPIATAPVLVNHIAPSGPAAIPSGRGCWHRGVVEVSRGGDASDRVPVDW